MSLPASKVLGVALVLAGAATLLATATAHIANVIDDPARVARGADASPAPGPSPSPRVAVALDAPTLHATRAVPLPERSPLLLPDVERHAAVDAGPLASARLDVDTRAPADTAPPATSRSTTASATHARLALTPATERALVAGAALAGAGALAYAWAGAKAWAARAGQALAAAPLLGLYARITRAELFDNPVRTRLFDAIQRAPGISTSDLARCAGVSWGTTIYHLEVLERSDMVTSLRNGRHRRYFENGATLGPAGKVEVALLQNRVTADVAARVRATPGITQKDLAGALGMTPQALHWHVQRLASAGLVRKRREGRVVRHYAG